MATSKQLQEQLTQESQQFQVDIDASVVYHDPLTNGFCWTITMPLSEYDARQEAIWGLQRAVDEVQEVEQIELSLDRFLHETE